LSGGKWGKSGKENGQHLEKRSTVVNMETNGMEYTFRHSDGRKYGPNSISDGLKLEANEHLPSLLYLTVSSSQEKKFRMELTLSSREAVAIAHCLLAATNSKFKISAIEKR
jgi:hypothetical protein